MLKIKIKNVDCVSLKRNDNLPLVDENFDKTCHNRVVSHVVVVHHTLD